MCYNALLQSQRSAQWSGRCVELLFLVHLQRGRWLFWWQIVFFSQDIDIFHVHLRLLLLCGFAYLKCTWMKFETTYKSTASCLLVTLPQKTRHGSCKKLYCSLQSGHTNALLAGGVFMYYRSRAGRIKFEAANTEFFHLRPPPSTKVHRSKGSKSLGDRVFALFICF